MQLKPNPKAGAPAPLVLDGDGLKLVSLKLDGETLRARPLCRDAGQPHHPAAAAAAVRLEIETVVDPSANTQLMGLYRSGATYCTQCEAEGFRRITYFPDRPDVMAVYTTRIEADKAEAPVLLANGNLVESGDVPGTSRHFAVWHDPFPKPSYLFALVGGDLALRRGHLPSPCRAATWRCASMSSPARRTAAPTPWTRSSARCAGTRRRSAANTTSTSS